MVVDLDRAGTGAERTRWPAVRGLGGVPGQLSGILAVPLGLDIRRNPAGEAVWGVDRAPGWPAEYCESFRVPHQRPATAATLCRARPDTAHRDLPVDRDERFRGVRGPGAALGIPHGIPADQPAPGSFFHASQ